MAEHIRRRLEATDGDALAYFFFNSTRGKSENIEAGLRSLIAQLCERERNLPVIVQKLFAQGSIEDKTPDSSTLVDVLVSLIKRQHQTFVIVDALDEAADTAGAVEIIRYLVEMKLENLHLLISSRLQVNIKEKLEAFVTCTVSMEDHAVDDLSLYIQKCLQGDARMKHWEDDLKREIEVSLIRRANTR